MTNKQLQGNQAADGSQYVCITDGQGNLINPSSSGQIGGNSAGSTGAVVGTLAAAVGKTTYIAGFNVSAAGSGSIGPITIAGLAGGSQVYSLTAPGSINQIFTPPLAGSAVNTAITVTTTADASATSVNVNAWGYQQ